MPRREGAVPVTILTGQLGSGKSTILRHVLKTKSRVAVIMNEFAQSASIEGKALTVASDGVEVTEWLELDNGCLCCSAQDNGVRALESLVEKKGTFDYIILETSGVADPSAIAPLFWLDEGLESVLYLDGVVTVVDALNVEKQLEEDVDGTGEVAKQIACGDALVISKTDLTPILSSSSPPHMDLIRSMNSVAPISVASNGSIDLSDILYLDAYGSGLKPPPSAPAPFPAHPSDSPQEHTHPETTVAPHRHGGLSTLSIPLPRLRSVTEGPFDRALRSLLWEGSLPDPSPALASGPAQILRCKGLLIQSDDCGSGQDRTYILQGVRELYELTEAGPANASDEARIVLIGRGLTDALKEAFVSYMAASEAS